MPVERPASGRREGDCPVDGSLPPDWQAGRIAALGVLRPILASTLGVVGVKMFF